jgi:signal transduction histidine kinase
VAPPRPAPAAHVAALAALAGLGGGVVGLVHAPAVAGAVALGAAAAVGLPSVALGLLVACRRPGNAVGALLAAVGALPCLILGREVYSASAGRRPGLPDSAVLVALEQGAWMWWYVPVALLVLFFPDGRLPGPRWRWVAAGLPAVAAAFMVLVARDPAPFPPPYETTPHALGTWSPTLVPALTVVALALLPVLLGLLVASGWSAVRRARTADPVRRAQLRWLALGGLCVPATLLLCWTSYLLLGGADLVLVGLALTYVALPAAVAVAILRHDLYDIDRLLSATATYALVTGVLLAVWTGAVAAAGLLLGGGSTAVAVVLTALTAVAVAPLRSRLQRRVDRRLYPSRWAALAAVEGLRARVDAGTARPEELQDVLAAALRDPGLRVGYRRPGRSGLVDAAGVAVEPGPGAVPVRWGGAEIGALCAASPPGLLAEVGTAAGLLVEVVRLRSELGEALHEVEASRARLLQAGYAERRRLERDLHDGAQQRLVSLGMALRFAQRHVGSVDVTVFDLNGVFDQAVDELATAVAELRRIAHGLRPSSLDDGLGPALQRLATTVPLPVELDICPEPLPDEIATTAYFVASEAVSNAVKHADAELIAVRVARDADRLQVSVRDDGRGGAWPRAGSGLAGLTDRVAAAGGALRVRSTPGRGTVVEAVLPCAS